MRSTTAISPLTPVEQIDAAKLDHVDVPFPGGQSYRDVVAGMSHLLAELARDHDGHRVLLVGHAATRYALDHLLTGAAARSRPWSRPSRGGKAGPTG